LSGQTIKVREEWRGTRGGDYYYVYEDNRLKRISKYAVKQTKVSEGGKGSTIEFEVPIDRIKGKQIYQLGFSNSGYFYARKGGIDAFLLSKYPEYPWIPDFDRMEEVKPEELHKLEMEIEDPLLKQILQELRTVYIRMIDDVKHYSERLGFEIWFGHHAERTADIFNDPEVGFIKCLSLQNDKARLKSLEVPMRWIHQIWIMALACDALNIKEVEKEQWQEKPMWWLEQGRARPTFIARSSTNIFSFWFEFQPSKGAHLIGLFVGGKVPIRPDILICRGKLRNAEEIGKVDLIIECKNKDFQFWRSDIEAQLIPYFERYKPISLILASMKSIPAIIKQKLKDVGINAVDNLAPGNSTTIQEFKKIVRQCLEAMS